MQYQDALVVATVLMLLLTATTFVPSHPYEALEEDPKRYCYDLLTFLLQAWITSFCGLTGLIVYVKRKEGTAPPSEG